MNATTRLWLHYKTQSPSEATTFQYVTKTRGRTRPCWVEREGLCRAAHAVNTAIFCTDIPRLDREHQTISSGICRDGEPRARPTLGERLWKWGASFRDALTRQIFILAGPPPLSLSFSPSTASRPPPPYRTLPKPNDECAVDQQIHRYDGLLQVRLQSLFPSGAYGRHRCFPVLVQISPQTTLTSVHGPRIPSAPQHLR